MMRSWDYGAVVSSKVPICLRVIDCGEELLYTKITQSVVNNKLTNWVSLSLNTNECVPYDMTQLFKNVFAVCKEDFGCGDRSC